jgi:hypothetical protein
MREDIKKVATFLVEEIAKSSDNIIKAYLFPSEEEIRLVEVDKKTIPNRQELLVFYFAPDPQGGVPFPSGIALMRPDEDKAQKPTPPEEWGSWDHAEVIWSKQSGNGA